MVNQVRPLQEQVSDIVALASSLLTLALLAGMVRVGGRAMLPEPELLRQLPRTIPEIVPLPELRDRLRKAADELGQMSLAELGGGTRGDRLASITGRELRPELGYTSYREGDDLRRNPLSTVESWLEPGGYAHRYPALHGIAQIVVEAAEAKVEKARAAVSPEVLSDINYRISQRTSYGLREEVAEAPGVVIVWSNASADWHDHRSVRKGERLVLDANQVFVPYPRNRVAAVLHLLEPLPLGKYSFEAIARKTAEARKLGLEGRMESDERWLRGMQALGLEVYAGPGYEGRVPVPGVSDLPGLAHIGGGTLAGRGKVFRLRANPETGTRFYVAEAAYG